MLILIFLISIFTKSAGADEKCNHQRIGVRTRLHANLDLELRGVWLQCKKRSQPTLKVLWSCSPGTKEVSGLFLKVPGLPDPFF